MASTESPASSQTMIARSYQTELLDHVVQRNSIICMGTGTGKTFIAIMLIKEKAHEVQKPFEEGGKRTFFLTNAVALARQQGEVIRHHTNLKVQTYVGADGVDQWMTEPGRWETEFKRNQVLVMTAQILLNILQHGLLPFSRINLLIFDECHHAKKHHAYVKIMEIGREAYENGEDTPHILGLTASILDKDVSSADVLEDSIAKIEQKLRSTAITSSDAEAMDMYGTKPEEMILECAPIDYNNQSSIVKDLEKILDNACYFVRSCEEGYKRRKAREGDEKEEVLSGEIPVGLETIIKDLDDYRVVLNILGPIASNFVAKKHLSKLKHEMKLSVVPVEVNRRFFRLGYCIFAELSKKYDDYYDINITHLEDAENLCPPKVRTLIKEILYRYGDYENVLTKEENEVNGLDEIDQLYDDDEDEDENDEIPEDDSEKDEDEESAGDDSGDEEIDMEPETIPNENLTGIVFVERRIASFALHKLLEEFFNWDSFICCIKSGYIVGGGGKGDSRDVQQTTKYQESILRAFRKKNINLLVSTSVLQEGIDIPKCNLVVLFDVPKNYREYVQAKGRARAANSKFCVLASNDELLDCSERIRNYQAFEEVIASKCLNREENKDEVIDDADDYLPPYKGPVLQDGAQAVVTMSSSVGLINQYCNLLPSDTYTRLAPECVYKEIIVGAAPPTFQCTIQLPMSCPVKDAVTGPIMPRKKLAQMATALQICELLHKAGELNDNLLPAYKGVEDIEDIINDEILGPGKLVDTGSSGESTNAVGRTKTVVNKRKQMYNKATATSLSDCLPRAGVPLCLYEVNMTLTKEVREYDGPKKAPEETPRGFGLLLSKKLPNIPDFPIYIRSGEVTIRLKLLEDNMILNEEQIENVLTYHRYVMQKVLNIEREQFTAIIFSPQDARQQIVMVPVQNGVIDWSFLEMIVSKKELKYLKYGKKFVWDSSVWEDAVVTRTYRDPPSFYHINEICTNMTPYSNFPNEMYTTFDDYYFTRYESLRIKNKSQPLLDVTQTSKRLALLTPRHLTTKGQVLPTSGKERHVTHFVPELCGIHVYPDSMWRKATYMPSIMYRLNSLLNAEELRVKIIREANICSTVPPENHVWPRLDFGFKLEEQLRPVAKDGEAESTEDDAKKEDEEKMKYMGMLLGDESTKDHEKQYAVRQQQIEVIENFDIFADVLATSDAQFGPSASHVLQALTMASANDFFDLERMEVMGDSFLKYIATVYLFRKYPDIHEGKLTRRRMILTSNKNLYDLGCARKIEELIISMPFAPNDNWLPPLYDVKEIAPIIREGKKGDEDEIIAYCMRTQHLMFDKHVADSIEALIGCYLISSGAKAARELLTWLGLHLKLDPKTPLPDPVLKTDPEWRRMLDKQTADLHVFEDSIQYRFNNKAYLLEAMTHPSYTKNRVTECYQRLEFLGDAILDYVITRFIFEDCKQHSPGLLTDLRSALVNNNIFAKLAVKYNYHNSFKYLSPDLYYVINRFVKAQDEVNNDIEAEYDIEADEDVEIPKALGDIFESVAGAIYLDSGFSLDTVWRVYYRMMKELIVSVTVNLPKSPIRELMELAPGAVSFSRPMKQESGKVKVTVTVAGDRGTYSGLARNHRLARVAAAKRAVKKLKEIESSGIIMRNV